ncbi:MAG TPA: histidine kinase, partial [Clostridiales bacterium UBA8960]|nr:histidine kinase [Clostridiales bacterium UBA8960]
MHDAALFDEIIKEEKITTLYQPIVNLKLGDVIGYEALSRGPEMTTLYSPLALIEAAHDSQRIWELEMLFRKKALERVFELEDDKLLFLNVDPDVIKAPEYKSGLTKEYLESLNFDETSIVFEITERTAINDYKAFHDVLDNYRNQGYLIAIDDVGAGYSGLKTINEVRPNFIKIDMDLVRNIDKDAFKQALLKAFVDTSMTTNIKIIAEGIETKEELKTLILLGVHAGQGYYLKKPSKKFELLEPEIVTRIRDYNKISRNLNE